MRKLLPFLALFSIIILFSTVIGTYAIFETDVDTGTQTAIGAFKISLNGDDLTGTDNTFNVTSVNWGTNDNVLPGRASPGLSAYFDIEIDPTGTEVAVDYEVELDFASLNNPSIQFVSIKDSLNNDLTVISPNVYGGSLTIAEVLANTKETIRVNFTWIDDDQNNAADSTHVNQLNSQINIPVIVRVSQHLD